MSEFDASQYEVTDEMMKDFVDRLPLGKPFHWDEIFEEGGLIRTDVWSDLMKLVKNDSSPGVPWMYEYNQNGDLKQEEFFKQTVEERIRMLLKEDFNIYDLREELDIHVAKDLVERGLCDPVRMFGKNEPTTKEKTRVISSVSIVDSIIDLLVSWPQIKAEISQVSVDQKGKKHWAHSSTIGIDLYTDSSNKLFYRRIKSQSHAMRLLGKRMVSSDISGFEWSYKVHDYQLYAKIQEEIDLRAEAERWVTKLRNNRIYCEIHVMLMNSDGELYVVSTSRMGSGSRRTAHADSTVRSFLPILIEKKFVLSNANGDDNIESTSKTDEGLIESYRKLGYVVTDVVEVGDDDEPFYYCSHKFTKSIAVPEAYPKGVHNLLSNSTYNRELFVDFWFHFHRSGLLNEDDLKYLISLYDVEVEREYAQILASPRLRKETEISDFLWN